MKDKISEHIPTVNIVEKTSKDHYVVDAKHLLNGKVEIHDTVPTIKYVHIKNDNAVPVYFNGFEDNALVIATGVYSRQCECVIFPQTLKENDWLLFIEMKYVHNIENAFRIENDYPNCMIDQIIKTVAFFRNKGIISNDRVVNAMLSFPTLIQDFSGSFFTGEWDVTDILLNYKIRMRPSNFANIISEKRIKI
jgi:hypothetical protein